MTEAIYFATPDTLMDEIAKIFETTNIHHIPVLDEDEKPVGMISKVDYYQIQDHFTRLGYSDYKEKNKRFMQSITAGEVMTKDPSCIHYESSIGTAIQIFLENLFHALPVTRGGKCIGIITTHDVLKFVNTPSKSLV